MKRKSSSRLARAKADDSGSALILALIVVMVVGMGLAVALDYTRVGLTLAPTVRDDRNDSNYIQGAVEGAIANIRGSSEAGRSDSETDVDCPDFTPSAPIAGKPFGYDPVLKKSFVVSCTGLDSGAADNVDRPRFAIHALGPAGVLQSSAEELYVNGGVYSKGDIEASNPIGTIRVNGTLTAEGDCPNPDRLITTDRLGLRCNRAASAFGADPLYQPAIQGDSAGSAGYTIADVASLSHNGPPDCVDNRVEFPEGYYDTNPQELVDESAADCPGNAVWHFAPGRYYFDFDDEWQIGNKVVGGTIADDWTDGEDLGGACDDTQPGVQFVFGGGSQVSTKSSSGRFPAGIELCGPPANHTWNGSPQRIVLYGLSDDNEVGTATEGQVLLEADANPTSSAASGSAGTAAFSPVSGARVIDTIPEVATASLTTAQRTGTLTYSSIAATPGLPTNAVISSVHLRARHLFVSAEATLTLDGPTMNPVPLDVDAGGSNCLATCRFEITDSFDLNTLRTDLADLTASYVITRASGGNGNPRLQTVDGFALEIAYTVPALRALTCIDDCDFFVSTSNPNVFMHGTVYAPSASWVVKVHNSGLTIFDRGIVMRDIAITMSSSSKQETSPFSLPAATPTGRSVLFIGKIDGVEKVRACADYVDFATSSAGVTSAYAGWKVAVPRWLVLRDPTALPAGCS